MSDNNAKPALEILELLFESLEPPPFVEVREGHKGKLIFRNCQVEGRRFGDIKNASETEIKNAVFKIDGERWRKLKTEVAKTILLVEDGVETNKVAIANHLHNINKMLYADATIEEVVSLLGIDELFNLMVEHNDIFEDIRYLERESKSEEGLTDDGTKLSRIPYVIGTLYGIRLSQDENANTVIDVVEEFAVACETMYDDINPFDFLINVFAHAIVKLVRENDSDEGGDRLNTLEERAIKTYKKGLTGVSPSQYLENIYSLAMAIITSYYNPNEITTWLDTIEQQARTLATKLPNVTPALFLSNLYSMVIGVISAECDPDEIMNWFETYERRAQAIATHVPHKTSGEFLTNFYSMAIEQVSNHYTPSEANDWLNILDQAIVNCASEDSHEMTNNFFLSNTYACAIAQVTPKYSPNNWQQHLLYQFLDDASPKLISMVYSRYHYFLSQSHDISAWLPFLVEDMLTRLGISSKGTETGEPSLEAAANVLSETILRLKSDPSFPTDLNSGASRVVLGVIADLAKNDPSIFDQLVDRTAKMTRDDQPSDWIVKLGAKPSKRTSIEFIGVTYSVALVEIIDSEGELQERFYSNAVNKLRATEEPNTSLLIFFSRALQLLSSYELPDDEPRIHRSLFEKALAIEEFDAEDLYLEYLQQLEESNNHGPSWIAYLAVDAIKRVQSNQEPPLDEDIQLQAAISSVVAALDSLYYTTALEGDASSQIVTAAETLESNDPDQFDPFAKGVAEQLEEEYGNDMAALEWQSSLKLI